MGKQLTHEYVAVCFEEQGCKLLDRYTKSSVPMRYRCKCGNESRSNWNNFMRGKRCQACLVDKRSGPHNYQWVVDRDRITIRKRYVCVVVRLIKVLGLEKDYSVDSCPKYFGCTFDELCAWVKSQKHFKEPDWEIDHIYPIWAFTEIGVTDLNLINGMGNIRVTTKKTNRQKCYKFNALHFVRYLNVNGAIQCL